MAFREADNDSSSGKKPGTAWFRVLDDWQCQPDEKGKTCGYGPNHKGVCGQDSPCQTKRTVRGRLKQVQRVVAFTIAVGLLAAVFFTTLLIDVSGQQSLTSKLMKPGDLSRAHAQILASVSDSDRCASCHEGKLTSWTGDNQDLASHPHGNGDMTTRCMECHKTSIAETEARHAHSMPRQTLVALTTERARIASTENGIVTSIMNSLARTSMDQSNVACSVCHIEHHGADFNIAHMSNGRCQSCHVERYDSFASDHPDFGTWPHGDDSMDRHAIAFDHGTHAMKHYPVTSQTNGQSLSFDCQSCHVADARGEVNRQVVYEQCSSCHDKDLRVALAGGFDLMNIPMIDSSVATRVNDWPEWAIGVGGDPLPLLHRWLIGREVSSRAMDSVAREGAGVEVAQATISLWRDLQSRGQTALVERLTSNGFSQQQIDSIAGQFSAQLSPQIQPDSSLGGGSPPRSRARKEAPWNNESDSLLGDTGSNANDSLLGAPTNKNNDEDDLFAFGSDESSADEGGLFAFGSDAPNPGSTKKRRPSDLQTLGGWFASSMSGSIRYRPVGHADQVLTATIEAAVERGEIQRLPAAANACLECHVSASRGNGWGAETFVSREPISRSFTRFSHRPHRNIDHLANCVSCHKLNEERGPALEGNEFVGMQREACASCHQPQLAGDACTICHRYHVDPVPIAPLQAFKSRFKNTPRRE
ncbi:MAG: hypothetical protein AAF664_01410 [Planctomycetota bacterium]